MNIFSRGDFVWFTDITKEEYPARILSISSFGNKTMVKVEISANKRKSESNDTYEMEGNLSQIRPRLFTCPIGRESKTREA